MSNKSLNINDFLFQFNSENIYLVSPYVADLEGLLGAHKEAQAFLIRINHKGAAKFKGNGQCGGKTGHMGSIKWT